MADIANVFEIREVYCFSILNFSRTLDIYS